MRHLILLRHGQSQINAAQQTQSIFCGQLDTPLTDFGRQQACNAGRYLADSNQVRISHAVSSTLRRASETLSLVLPLLHPQPCRLPNNIAFNERSLGLFEGRLEEDVLRQFPEYRDDPQLREFRADFQQKAPGGENLTEVAERAHAGLLKLMPDVTEDLLLVAHCQTIRCLIMALTGCPPDVAKHRSIPNAQPLILTPATTGLWQLLSPH